jgi:hypothetical protein
MASAALLPLRSEKVTYQTGAEHRLIWGIDPESGGSLDDVEGCSPRLTRPGFQLVNCYQANARF